MFLAAGTNAVSRLQNIYQRPLKSKCIEDQRGTSNILEVNSVDKSVLRYNLECLVMHKMTLNNVLTG